MANVGAVAQYKPEVLDRINADAWVETYADALGVTPAILIPKETAEAIRQQRAQAQQEAQQSALLEQAASTAQKLAAAPTDQPNALTNVMSGLTGYS